MCKVMGRNWYARISLVALTICVWTCQAGNAADGRVVYSIKNYGMTGGGFYSVGDHVHIFATQTVDNKMKLQQVVEMAYIIEVKDSPKVKGISSGIDLSMLLTPHQLSRMATLRYEYLDFVKVSKREIEALRHKK